MEIAQEIDNSVFLLSTCDNHKALIMKALEKEFNVVSCDKSIVEHLMLGNAPKLIIIDKYSQPILSQKHENILMSYSRKVPKLLITGTASPHAEEERDALGALDYLIAPFSISTLVKRISYLMAFGLVAEFNLA